MITEYFYDQEYVLVDEYEYNGRIIYHFALDDENIFCYKTNNKYIEIDDDEIINAIIDKYDLRPSEVLYKSFRVVALNPHAAIKEEELTEQEKQEYINQFIELLENSSFINVDINKIRERLNKVTFLKGEIKDTTVAGFYHPARNSITFDRHQYLEKYYFSTIIHEIIHACGGSLYNIADLINSTGLTEGKTESLALKLLNEQKGSIGNGVYINNSSKSYQLQVSLLRQMESTIGLSSVNSILNGNTNFDNIFKEKYGIQLLTYLKKRSTRLIKKEKQNDEDVEKYFEETQNTLLKKVFDQDYKEIHTLNDIKKYLAKLKELQFHRGKVKDSTFFKNYYEEKYNEFVNRLKKNGLSKPEIEREIGMYKYEADIELPLYTNEEIINGLKNGISIDFPSHLNEDIKDFDLENAKIMFTGDYKNYYAVYFYNNEFIGMENYKYNKGKVIKDLNEINAQIIGDKLIIDGEEHILKEIPLPLENKEELNSKINKKLEDNRNFTLRHELSVATKTNEMLNLSPNKIQKNSSSPININSYIKDLEERTNNKYRTLNIPIRVTIDINGITFNTNDEEIERIINDIAGSTHILHNNSISLIDNLSLDRKYIEEIRKSVLDMKAENLNAMGKAI